jgi:PPOX class probable F420-dependent enzyme
MLTEDQRDFIATHRLCVVGVARRAGPPSLTPVYYVVDGDDLLISTTAARAKTKLIRRNPEVSVCVLAEEFPFPYVTVFGQGRIEDEGVVEVMLRVGELMRGRPATDEERVATEQRAVAEGRVVLRVTPERAVSTPPRGRRA